MTIRAVVFDIGGVLELTPPTGWVVKWEARLHLNPGELDARFMDVWRAGTLGTISEEEVEKRIGKIMEIDQEQVAALMADLREEYLGELNVELAAYFASLRPRYQTAILSNSFASARDKEQERYHFADLCDFRETKEAIAAVQTCLQTALPAVTYTVRSASSGEENALEGEDCGSIDS